MTQYLDTCIPLLCKSIIMARVHLYNLFHPHAEMVSYSVLEDVLSYVGQETSAFVWQILYGNGNLVYNPKHHPPNFYERKVRTI